MLDKRGDSLTFNSLTFKIGNYIIGLSFIGRILFKSLKVFRKV